MGNFADIFNLLLNRFKLVDATPFLQLFLQSQVAQKAGMKMYYNTPENFHSLGFKCLILSRYYNDVASMNFINSDKMGLADETIYFISFS